HSPLAGSPHRLALAAVGAGRFSLSRRGSFGGLLSSLALAQLPDALADLGLHELHAFGIALGAVLTLPSLVASAGSLDRLRAGLGFCEWSHARPSEDDHGIQVRSLLTNLDGLALAAIGLVPLLHEGPGSEASTERLDQVARLEPCGEQLLGGSLRPL